MSIQYSISETDYANSVRLAATATRKQKAWLCTVGFGLLLLGLLGPDSLKGMGYFGLFFGILGYFATLHLISPWQAKRQYRCYKSIQKPINILLQDCGFTVSTDSGQSIVKWENLLRWREDRNYILIYFAPKLFYLVPKRIADSGFDLEGFRRSLREKSGEPV